MEKLLREKWNDILEFMKTEYNLTNVAYNTWLLPLAVHSVKGNTIIISIDDSKVGAFSVDFIKNKYEELKKESKDLDKEKLKLSFWHHFNNMLAKLEKFLKSVPSARDEIYKSEKKDDTSIRGKRVNACIFRDETSLYRLCVTPWTNGGWIWRIKRKV